MKRINVYSLKMVKDSAALYDLPTKKIGNPADVAKAINAIFDLENDAAERFGILTLTMKNEIAGAYIVSMGSLSSSIVHPREVFKLAVLSNAASIILFHNHPSGEITPSREDLATTKRLVDCGELMGISVIDHLIIGRECFRSFRETGDM